MESLCLVPMQRLQGVFVGIVAINFATIVRVPSGDDVSLLWSGLFDAINRRFGIGCVFPCARI
jgi:hypothetical protein